MQYLNRDNTSLADEIWKRIDVAAVKAIKPRLTARRFLDLEGPYGVGLTSLEIGADEFCRPLEAEEAVAVLSRAVSVPMLRKNFKLSIRRVEAYLTMGQPLQLNALEDAAEALARREEDLIYYGAKDFSLSGLLTVEDHQQVKAGDWSRVEQALEDVLKAVTALDKEGFFGPYALVLSAERYKDLFRRYEGTDMLQHDHLRRLCRLGIHKAAIDGAVLVDERAGKLVLGQDAMVGFSANDGIHYHLFISESIVPVLHEPKAICTLDSS